MGLLLPPPPPPPPPGPAASDVTWEPESVLEDATPAPPPLPPCGPAPPLTLCGAFPVDRFEPLLSSAWVFAPLFALLALWAPLFPRLAEVAALALAPLLAFELAALP